MLTDALSVRSLAVGPIEADSREVVEAEQRNPGADTGESEPRALGASNGILILDEAERRRSGRGQRWSDPSLQHRVPARGSRRASATHNRHETPLEGARRRSVAGRPAGDDPGALSLLGDGLRLAQVRG